MVGSPSIFRGGGGAGSSSIYRIEGETPAPSGGLTWDEIPGNWDEVPGNFDEAGQP